MDESRETNGISLEERSSREGDHPTTNTSKAGKRQGLSAQPMGKIV